VIDNFLGRCVQGEVVVRLHPDSNSLAAHQYSPSSSGVHAHAFEPLKLPTRGTEAASVAVKRLAAPMDKPRRAPSGPMPALEGQAIRPPGRTKPRSSRPRVVRGFRSGTTLPFAENKMAGAVRPAESRSVEVRKAESIGRQVSV
jgi:hypothetical protein